MLFAFSFPIHSLYFIEIHYHSFITFVISTHIIHSFTPHAFHLCIPQLLSVLFLPSSSLLSLSSSHLSFSLHIISFLFFLSTFSLSSTLAIFTSPTPFFLFICLFFYSFTHPHLTRRDGHTHECCGSETLAQHCHTQQRVWWGIEVLLQRRVAVCCAVLSDSMLCHNIDVFVNHDLVIEQYWHFLSSPFYYRFNYSVDGTDRTKFVLSQTLAHFYHICSSSLYTIFHMLHCIISYHTPQSTVRDGRWKRNMCCV